eukprot:TRINITY_DN7178_c0_g1_i1.p1 TRINITY_DN7178_c0_g1~~TRINITY_DN7178_c0_g1_i1.p1  ORF type:complete len:524 (-),score=187.33 TRINITY_DN7178_c0_g1_i1:71-1642(-)
METRNMSALQANRHYQEVVLQQLRQIEQAIQRNNELQSKVRAVLSHSNQVRRAAAQGQQPVRDFKRAFVDANGQEPEPNADTVRKAETLAKLPLEFKAARWKPAERRALWRGVRQHTQQALFEQLMRRYHTQQDTDIEAFQRDSARLRDMPESELLQIPVRLDWHRLAADSVPGRSASDCELWWRHHEAPSLLGGVNVEQWSKDEDKRLLQLVAAHRGHDWAAIATQLATNRQPYQCFQRYQRALNSQLVRGRWSTEEDATLASAVAHFGERNWEQVAQCLEGRTGQQCLHRWMKTVHPGIRRGRWTPAEDTILRLAVKHYQPAVAGPWHGGRGAHWQLVARHVPGRTDMQCRERWFNTLDPSRTLTPWTADEEAQLDAIVTRLGVGHWSAVAQALATGRNDHACMVRWRERHRDEAAAHAERRLKQQLGLVRVWAHSRRRHRSELDADDFDLDPEFRPPPKVHRRATPATTMVAQVETVKEPVMLMDTTAPTGNEVPNHAHVTFTLGPDAARCTGPWRRMIL